MVTVPSRQGRSTVALSRCPGYDPAGVCAAMGALLAPLGGMEAFVKPGQTVLLKPNLLTARTPDQAVTTHPEVIRAVIRLVKAAGGKPSVADSPTNVTKLEAVWEKTGILAVCQEEGIPLVNLEKSGSKPFTLHGISFTVALPVVEADVLINLPKVKTHVLTILTGAVKNLYGTIPGLQKAQLHKAHPTPREFGCLLTALYAATRPELSIADGIVGMHGDGPSAGQPVAMGFLAASADAVALDTVLCHTLGLDPRTVPYFEPLRQHALGETRMEQIDISGEDPRSLRPQKFRIPSTVVGRLIPGWLVKQLGRLLWFRPDVGDACVFCGLCARACPMSALEFRKAQKPLLDPGKCIGCCCCHEVCPEKAIRMVQSPFLNFIRRGRLP